MAHYINFNGKSVKAFNSIVERHNDLITVAKAIKASTYTSIMENIADVVINSNDGLAWSADDVKKVSYASSFKTLFNDKNRVKTTLFKYIKKRIDIDYDDKYLTKFVSMVMIHRKDIKPSGLQQIKEVTGEDIRHYYLENNNASGNNTLQSSCMNSASCQDYLSILVDNCRLAIVSEDNFKTITHRALIWSTTDDIEVMDRVYCSVSGDEGVLLSYAKQNGYRCKVYQDYSSQSMTMTPNNKYINEDFNVKLKYSFDEYSSFPYLDTFCYSDDFEYLTNNNSYADYIFCNTNGTVEGYNDGETCEHCGGVCDEDEMTHVEDVGYVCDECIQENYVCCDDCGEYHNLDESTYVDQLSEWRCEGCAGVYTCNDCGETFVDGIRLNNGDAYCDGCHSNI